MHLDGSRETERGAKQVGKAPRFPPPMLLPLWARRSREDEEEEEGEMGNAREEEGKVPFSEPATRTLLSPPSAEIVGKKGKCTTEIQYIHSFPVRRKGLEVVPGQFHLFPGTKLSNLEKLPRKLKP